MSQATDHPADDASGLQVVALDGGTTNTRARLIREGRIVATCRRGAGVRDNALGRRGEPRGADAGDLPSGMSPLSLAVRAAIEDVVAAAGSGPPDLIVAAGMLSSELGLAAVPHVPAPAGIGELAAGMVVRTIPEVSSIPIRFVPGVKMQPREGPDGWMHADVMRGEECETIGALEELGRQGAIDPEQGGLVFVWPGSHTKVVEVDAGGRIVGFHSSLAGELIQAVAQGTLIAGSLPSELPTVLDPSSVAAGARAVEEQGLPRAAFLVRIAMLQDALDAAQRASFWIGAVVSEDARLLARHPILARARWVGVGGREPLRGLYTAELARRVRASVNRLDDELCERASAMGALAVALSGGRTRGGADVSPR